LYYFTSHLRVVTALVIREMSTRFGKNPGGYLWALLEPIAYIAFMSLIFMAIAHKPALGTSFPLFFASGFVCFQFYAAMAGYLNSAVNANRPLLSYPNVAPIDTISARFSLQFCTTCVVAICIIAPLIMQLKTTPTIRLSPILTAISLGSLIALGLALANNVLFQRFPLYDKIFGIVSRPLFLISGIFYLPDSLPPVARDAILINPIAHLVMLFRTGLYPEYRAIGFDLDYLLRVTTVLLFAGMAIFTISRGVLRAR